MSDKEETAVSPLASATGSDTELQGVTVLPPDRITVVPLRQRSRRDEPLLELGGGGPQERDWRGIGTALLVIMVICTLIFLCGFIFTPLDAVETSKSRMNFSDIGGMRSPIHGIRWTDERGIYFEVAGGTVERMDIGSGERKKIVDRDTMMTTHGPPNSFESSHDVSYFALFNKAPNPSLNPDTATMYTTILNVKTHQKHTVRAFPSESLEQSQSVFEWSPSTDEYVFVQENNIYYAETATAKNVVCVSKQANLNGVSHGVFDWVYDEEIFGNRKALWWSPSGRQLAFASRRDNATRTVGLTSYDRNSSYPVESELPYPKTGEKRLPSYDITIWDKKSGNASQKAMQLTKSADFHYLFAVNWVVLHGKEVLVVVWANRWQNQISITLCNFENNYCPQIMEYKYPPKMWAMPEDFRPVAHSDDAIFLLLPRQKADGNAYQHIARIQPSVTYVKEGGGERKERWLQLGTGISLKITKNSKAEKHTQMIVDQKAEPTFLSLGSFDVNQIVKYDKATDSVYFLTNAPSPGNTHLYATKAKPSSAEEWRCVSCLATNCTSQDTRLSPDMKHIVIHCQGPSMPQVYLADFDSKASPALSNVQEILHDDDFEKRVQDTQLPVVINEVVPLGNGFDARVQLLIPPDQLNKANSRSLPVLVKVYGGPGFQMVHDKFKIVFEEYMVTTKNMAVLKIDGRGSGHRGWNYRSPVYGDLGNVEMTDQIDAIKEMLKRYPFLDPSRLSVFGWSYGGFASANMVEMADTDFFKCAVSVAPVSNFKFYDATYTERYMGDTSLKEYTDISRDVSKFKSTKLLLMHGLFDDNVHFQNSALFIEQLQANLVDFELMVYPNQDHAIGGKQQHVYQTIENFLTKCLFPAAKH